jgi:hypothetical protein
MVGMPMERGPRLDPIPRSGEHFVKIRIAFAHLVSSLTAALCIF